MLKYCAFFSLCASLGLSADFVTGQAARLVIGQTTFTSQIFGASNTVIGSIGGLAYAPNNGGTLLVTDANRLGLLPINNRVLMFSNISSLPQPADQIPPFSSRCPVCGGVATTVLGQPDFSHTSVTPARTASGMNLPLAVATDGVHVAVADTANNRVLLWNNFPNSNGQPADVVLGQPDFTTIQPVQVTASSLRAPQGVWIQGKQLFVADTQNNRVLIWNSIPTKNNQAADLVLGQPNFATVPQFDQTKNSLNSSATTMLTPTSVNSDGVHLFVTDLGFSRVLIWNTIPTHNTQAADVEVGQLDMATAIPNNAPAQCASNGTDANSNPTYPRTCAKTMSFPRYALGDGKRLYVADGGNDRVLVFSTVPTANNTAADFVLGQPDEFSDVVTSNNTSFGGTDLTTSASNVTPTPTSLAWDGTNLYVADPTDFRVLVFTPLQPNIPTTGVVNAASIQTFANGTISLGGTINPGDTVTFIINGTSYAYTLVSGDTFDTVLTALATKINGSNNGAGDPSVIAQAQLGAQFMNFVARVGGVDGNNITLATKVNDGAQIAAQATTATLTGGGSVSTIAPGTIISILGTNLADTFAQAPANAQTLPLDLGGVEVYIDGIKTPLYMVAPADYAFKGAQSQINAQVPWELVDTNSSSLYVRTTHTDGSVTVTDAIGLPITGQNPGIFAETGPDVVDPRPAFAYHASSFATGTITVTGGVNAGDTATVGVEDRLYNYVVQGTDTLQSIRDALIGLVNSNTEEKVVASAAPAYTSIRLQAKIPGPEGNGIAYSATSTGTTSTAAGSVVLTSTALTLCCANIAGSRITANNPALAGETIYVMATGLGLVGPNEARQAIHDGVAYNGPASNDPESPVTAFAGGASATVISAGLQVGAIGVYKVVLELGNSLSTDPATQLSISQNIFTSNIVRFPVYSPNPTQ
jgi:uncharacterized protein (TIGR03437 family)